MELRPLGTADLDLLTSLEEQEDVWENLGTLPFALPAQGPPLFAVVEGQASIGVAGLVPSRALGDDDYELVCALKEEVQTRGLAKQACQLVMSWAFDTAKLERVIACIDESNEPARTIAGKLGMKVAGSTPPRRTVYVKYRDEGRAAGP
jgi:RimJ/RimL family protein N-acetyltransferase